MSVSMTKDTVFSAFLLLQLVSLADLLWEDRNAWRPGIRDLLFALGTVGMILFRNNGKYAMIVLLAFTFLTFCFGKKERKLWGRLLSKDIPTLMWHATVPVNLSGYICTC